MVRRPRILLVEDSVARVEWFQAWLDPRLQLLWTPDAGRAIGTVRRDRGNGWAGLMLDHDLTEQRCTDRLSGSGTNVVDAILRWVPRHLPVLVHSSNITKGPEMASRLASTGFDVTRCSFPALTERAYRAWQDEVLEIWDAY
ncbi:MAG: hypothetical protein GY884_32485, partial [Proteobacteria bacterium]|nr:hypothetical protein [Pseudomonadota bacterium]